MDVNSYTVSTLFGPTGLPGAGDGSSNLASLQAAVGVAIYAPTASTTNPTLFVTDWATDTVRQVGSGESCGYHRRWLGHQWLH